LGGSLEPLRWKYRIDIDVEETESRARARGFRVRTLEGLATGKQSEYPLGQIEISGGALKAMNAKIVISPHVTQVYEKSEVWETESIESILRDIAVPLEGETRVFSRETLIEVKTISLLELRRRLETEILRLQEEEEAKFERRQAQARLDLKGDELLERLSEIWEEEVNRKRSILEKWVAGKISGAKEKLDRFNELCAILDRWNAELALAKGPIEKSEILMKHRRELDRMICDKSGS